MKRDDFFYLLTKSLSSINVAVEANINILCPAFFTNSLLFTLSSKVVISALVSTFEDLYVFRMELVGVLKEKEQG